MDKKPKKESGGAPEWMVTYGDLVTLLMCFFVLLFAFSEIDAQKFNAVMQSFQGSAGVLEAGKSLSEDQLVFDASPEKNSTPRTTEVEELLIVKNLLEPIKAKIEDEFKGSPYEESVEIEIENNKLVIRLKNNVLFDSARADIKPGAIEVLTILGEILKGDEFLGTEIAIQGHTDNVPINTERFPSNWELSGARSVSVLKHFINDLGFDETRLSTAGYAEYKPIDTNETAEGRANNRRVEIIIEKFTINATEDSE